MTTYRIVDGGVLRIGAQQEGAFIPDDPANADWQEYQAWLAEGHAPIPAAPSRAHAWDEATEAWVVDPALQAAESFESKLNQDFAEVRTLPAVRQFLRMSPAEIDAYIDANMTNIAQARAIVKTLAKAVAVSTRAALARGEE
jgi:hypothetical protein